jgi:hypothetical protein
MATTLARYLAMLFCTGTVYTIFIAVSLLFFSFFRTVHLAAVASIAQFTDNRFLAPLLYDTVLCISDHVMIFVSDPVTILYCMLLASMTWTQAQKIN